MQTSTPTQQSQRIISLDILRGFAIMGILIMNMTSFSMVSANYNNPMAAGVLAGADEWAFWFSELFANQKFISLFSMLFGAGVILMSSRIEAKSRNPLGRHYLRNFWLLLIGLFHAYVIWYGDILVAYALCSVWVFLFRKKSANNLFIWGGIFMSISLLISLFFGLSMPYWPEEAVVENCSFWQPSEESLQEEIMAYQGGWGQQQVFRAEMSSFLETFVFLTAVGWQVTGLMLIGMGLFKAKILTGERTARFYKRMLIIGLGLGLTLGIYGLLQNYAQAWSCEYSFFLGSQFHYVGSLPMALGYIAAVMLVCQGRYLPWLQKWIAPVGRMALTNYLMQSIIATFIFYGHGLGLYGTVGRAGQWPIILGIWLLQLLYSRWWLSRFKFGPFEWAWRSLTYGKVQAFNK